MHIPEFGVYLALGSFMWLLLSLSSACLLLSGCAGVFFTAPPETKELAATLTYVAGDVPLSPLSGIASVGNYYFTKSIPRLVHLAPGYRQIGYYCPQRVYVDGPATIGYKFLGGHDYEVYCTKGVANIRPVPHPAKPNHSSKRTREKPRAA